MRRLAIDIGSNTIKCLLADATARGVSKIFEKTLDTRISCGNGLKPDASNLISDSISEFLTDAVKYGGEFKTFAVATSAVRDAQNSREVCRKVLKKTGVKIRVLSGEDEARYSYVGAFEDAEIPISNTNAFFDLGGGSMELVLGSRENMTSFLSFPVGAVSMTERFFGGELPSRSECDALGSYIFGLLTDTVKFDFPKPPLLIGAGGAVAAARIMRRNLYSGGIENEITLPQISEMLEIISRATVAERIERFSIPKSRADIIPAAFVCIESLMNFLGEEKLVHTFYNLRYGLIKTNKFWR